ncbi:MAG: hypothetical protein K2W95_35725 [Candidatus Obscuribacterales bacterium]|nr:hypothetical protein [Candidatus Obscuribacterales bacterium]
MDANNYQEIKLTSEVDDDLDQDKRAALQADAYDGTVPPRPSSTVNLGNLELIQTGPITGPIEPKPSCPSSAEESSRPRPSDTTTGPSKPDGESVVVSRPHPAEPQPETTDGKTQVGNENDDFRRVGTQELLNLEKADKLFDAVKTNEVSEIAKVLKELRSHPESIDFVRDYLQKKLGLQRDEIQIVFNRNEYGFTSLQLELCKIDWPGEFEKRPASGTRLIIDSDESAKGFCFLGRGWTPMNAQEALKTFYAPPERPRPEAPVSTPIQSAYWTNMPDTDRVSANK